jgi:Fur family ferric uptake transcriptional regulator
MDPALRERIYDFIEQRGLRRTAQREAIINAAFETTDHYTAEELLVMARKLDPSVSRATVYRTLPLLVESGTLREMDFGLDQRVYDPNYNQHPNHNHLICSDCSRIIEFEDVHIDTLEQCISKRLGFTPLYKTVRIHAACDNFRKLGTCPNRKPATTEPAREPA